MATTKKAESVEVEILNDVKAVEDDGYVEIPPLFYDGDKYKDPLPIIINGKKWSIPRDGRSHRVPKPVAEVYWNSVNQDAYAAKIDREMQKAQIMSLD